MLCSFWFFPYTIISSEICFAPGILAIIELIVSWNTSLAEFIPKFKRLYLKRPCVSKRLLTIQCVRVEMFPWNRQQHEQYSMTILPRKRMCKWKFTISGHVSKMTNIHWTSLLQNSGHLPRIVSLQTRKFYNKWFKTASRTNMCILNGRSGLPGDIGSFTCMTHNGQSVVDMVLTSCQNLVHHWIRG